MGGRDAGSRPDSLALLGRGVVLVLFLDAQEQP
jgi:hypothetical protein